MKTLLTALWLISLFSGGLNTITKVNKLAREAAAAYQQKNFVHSIATYNYLLKDLEVEDDQLRLNLAHSYYRTGAYEQAQQEYQLLADHPSSHLRAIVHLQLGNIAGSQQKYNHALALYKQALIIEPANETARYNYELLKKYLELHPESTGNNNTEELPETPGADSTAAPASEELEPEPATKPDEQGTQQEETETMEPDTNGQEQQKKTNVNQQEKEREEKSGRTPGNTLGHNPEGASDPKEQRRQDASENITEEDGQAQTRNNRQSQLKLTPDKAKLLLDAMRNVELQYLQQLPKKPTKKQDPSLPDW